LSENLTGEKAKTDSDPNSAAAKSPSGRWLSFLSGGKAKK